MLTEAQHFEFKQTGLLRLPRAVPDTDVTRMYEAVWDVCLRRGIHRLVRSPCGGAANAGVRLGIPKGFSHAPSLRAAPRFRAVAPRPMSAANRCAHRFA